MDQPYRLMNMRDALAEIKDRVEEWSEGKILNFSHLPLKKLHKLPKNVTHLDCSVTPLKSLKNLPSSLVYLDISDTDVEELGNLPDTLTYLNISRVPLRVFPEKLPPRLEYLYISEVDVRVLPELPSTLKYLDCNLCEDLETLPDVLPENLEYINCMDTLIRTLPENLPPKLHTIECIFSPLHRDLQKDTLSERQTRLDLKREKERLEREEKATRDRCIRRCKTIKRALMCVTWHTDRVLAWCDPKAFDFED